MRGLADDLTCTAALELVRAAMLLSFKLSEIVCRQTTIFGACCSRCGTPPGTHSSSTALYRSLSAIALNNMLATAEPRADLTCSRIFGPSKRIERSSVLCSLAWSPSGPLLIVTSAGTASERCLAADAMILSVVPVTSTVWLSWPSKTDVAAHCARDLDGRPGGRYQHVAALARADGDRCRPGEQTPTLPSNTTGIPVLNVVLT
jgi:hypothetical protein